MISVGLGAFLAVYNSVYRTKELKGPTRGLIIDLDIVYCTCHPFCSKTPNCFRHRSISLGCPLSLTGMWNFLFGIHTLGPTILSR